jgi:FKBP-type peptidyl-prolyl cis-trans isomerase FkpA
MTDDEKIIYAVGLVMQQSLSQFDLSPAELEIFKRAVTDATTGKPAIELEEWGPKIDPLVRDRRARVMAREKAASIDYLAKAGAEAGAIKTASGLVYREVTAGTGASPAASSGVRVHYRGTLINGTEFDSSYARNEPAEFSLGGVIPCWTEGVQRMRVGGKARLVCPSDLAYGDGGSPPIPGGATLVFEIELLDIVTAR